MVEGFCETDDVADALQEDSNFPGSPTTSEVEAAIEPISDWFARETNGYWYDSGGQASDLVPTSATSVTHVRKDVPSSPHRQDRQLLVSEQGIRYPTTRNGPYARIQLPHRYVTSLDALNVRDRDGGVTDWVADSDIDSGRGNDYYLQQRGQQSYGRTYLYVRASTIGPRTDFGELLDIDYTYGLDAQTTEWTDVRRGIAHLAAAGLLIDDDVQAAIPDDGQLVPVETAADEHTNDAMRLLGGYLDAPIA